MSQHMGTRRVHPDEERLAVLLSLVHERDGGGRYHLVKGRHVVFDAGHWTRRQRTFVDDLLLAHLAPPGLHRGVVYVRRPAMDEIARTDRGVPFRRIGVIPSGVSFDTLARALHRLPTAACAGHDGWDRRCRRVRNSGAWYNRTDPPLRSG